MPIGPHPHPSEPAPRSRRAPAVVAIGGGSGLSVVLRGLKELRIGDLSAVVTMSDDGGSSGRLRREYGVLPPGDIRNCLSALAGDEDLLARLFQYRFPGSGDLAGHSFGNLFLTALTGITGDFYQAVLTAESILSVRGRILPATLTHTRLLATGVSGRRYVGESAIGQAAEAFVELDLEPLAPPAFGAAVEAIERATVVLLGPGSLYTSILPNLLIPAVREALRAGKAPVVLLMNLMTQPGETERLSAGDHLAAIERHAGSGLVDAVLVNSARMSRRALRLYAATGARPVAIDRAALRRQGVQVVEADLLAPGDLIRHDPRKLATAALAIGMRLARRPEAGRQASRSAPPRLPVRAAGGGDTMRVAASAAARNAPQGARGRRRPRGAASHRARGQQPAKKRE